MLAFSAPHGSSLRGIEYHIAKTRSKNFFEYPIKKQTLHELLYKLRKDGLVERKKKSGKIVLTITEKGKGALKKLQTRLKFSLPKIVYSKKPDIGVKIVIFDIPESERRKRGWIRSALRHFNFKMLQQSVWIGKLKLPNEFIDDLRKLNLQDCVEIFAVSKAGSLRRIDMQ